ncbi:hypothetical protein ACFLZB_04170 [Nanoarchaeota archaeon]
MAKYKETENIKEYKRLKKHTEKAVDTLSLHHDQGFVEVAEKHLKDNKGQIDYERLEDSGIQKEFTKDLSDFYIKKASDYFNKINPKELDEDQKALLMNAYAGVTESNLRKIVADYGKDLKLEKFQELKGEFMKTTKLHLIKSSSKHLTDEDLEGIIKYIPNIKKLVKTDKMNIEDAAKFLEIFETYGALTVDGVKNYALSTDKNYLIKKTPVAKPPKPSAQSEKEAA